MSIGTVHVIGAGVAGLSAATTLATAGRAVIVYESAGHAGGRCRTFFDETLDRRIDNGNHLVLSGNESISAYLRDIDAADALTGPESADFPFFDVMGGQRWRIAIGDGRIPWWMFSTHNRPPGAGAIDLLKGVRLLRAGPNETVAGCLANSRAYTNFWEPLALAILNTAADEGAASLMGAVLRETVLRGGRACRPLIARSGLGDAFVDPALVMLGQRGVEVRFGARLRELVFEDSRVAALRFGDQEFPLAADDAVILAVPAWTAGALVPGLPVPEQHRTIVNGHFLLPEVRDGISFMGLIGGLSQWLFVRDDVASVTVSAADDVATEEADVIASRMWPEVARALGISSNAVPLYRIVKERRATFAQTPGQVARRPKAETAWQNLTLAGDWVSTGLPATIEGAVRSGRMAAELASEERSRT